MADGGGERLRFEVLGLLRAVRGGGEVDLGAAKQRAVLAVLLLARNTPVNRGQIIEAVWGDNTPSSAVNLVQTYVAGLRRALEPRRARRAPAELLTSVGDGYLLRVDPNAVDLDEFERGVATAARLRSTGDLVAAATTLDDALSLWRGEPLGGVAGLFAEVERGRLAERRLAVLEERAELLLLIGRGAELVPSLTTLVGEHPLRERGHGLLMRALCQAGRQAEALGVYREARRVLIDELGVEPGPELRKLQQAVLSGENPEPERPTRPMTLRPVGESAPAITPAQLPRASATLIGRDDELKKLDGLLAAHQDGGLVLVVTGPAGVGKTALALHWAQTVREDFPDGQLYVDLHGYDPNQEPLGAGEVLSRFLRTLGVPSPDIPVTAEERSALFRTLIADRRMVVMLDNARGSTELLPLLPGPPSCVVVTSRRRLVGLVAHAEARLVELDMLDVDASVAVVGRIAGRDGTEAAALRRLAVLCDGLPLALRIAAARLAVAPTLRVAELVAELDDEHGRLAALGLEDEDSTVRAALDASRRALSPLPARLLALLGLHPGPDVTAFVVAAMARVRVGEAQRALDALTAANLLSVNEPGRYGAHDLVRVYTRTLAAELPADVRREATGRMLDFYLHCADLADGQLPVGRGSVRVAPEHVPVELPKLSGPAAATAWLDAEQGNIIAAAELAAAPAAAPEWPVHAWQLPYTLSRFLWLRADRTTWLRTTEAALEAATTLGDPEAKFVMLFNLGIVLAQFQRMDESLVRHREALDVARASGDLNAQARALTTVADMLAFLGRLDESEASYREALDVSRSAGSRWAEANAHHNLGLLHLSSKRYDDAKTWLRAAVTMYREVGEQCGESTCHTDLAVVLLESGEEGEALASARTALSVASAAASPYHQAMAHDRLATVFDRLGLPGAVAHWQRALALFTELNAQESDQVRERLARARATTAV
ncbi:DNA-binding SARP family transcriptional activator/tetratricopeptide (TPR) repeat protein [Saccharothrix ecbatanensis]|uniref:DNA-binding SARP family transcriptional activator/tetratricopeptide (TPR) repeat protein n=1 Tax=Saccharothrix ecbatanensis TaxID=1105145 RepID=A0A7W9HMK4_9PSEU|nr:BTAD domain-containing putative transcriptional regulator [Saccharothrix ecbatanensis]MBB5805054.1 DNA-binding SARP family transcriptional activator/tetratricopeptide (TPR) repeat protein [Saccharothrix ecbatanensis]